MESWRAGDDERRTMNDVLYRSIKRPVESCVRRVESNPVDWIRFISAVLCTRWKNFPHPPIHSKANQPASQSDSASSSYSSFAILLCFLKIRSCRYRTSWWPHSFFFSNSFIFFLGFFPPLLLDFLSLSVSLCFFLLSFFQPARLLVFYDRHLLQYGWFLLLQIHSHLSHPVVQSQLCQLCHEHT